MIYPTVAEVQSAPLALLLQWAEKLPAPQTDVEKTVRRRIDARLKDTSAFSREEVSAIVHAQDSELGAKWDRVMGLFDQIVAKVGGVQK
ncbi:hypothetical protein [Noviherbaspirillum sp. Root189]|uniref:hypothetical protein n=1 Tax=Noviherbaspirillum sp. Root189 TaxID=1736487 RepID=UPI00070D7148|nr:hypothetical protein [Noviherbaspirillum sp. Root189]KRB73475.1 hypothetical protein ASE07_06380 [Noviherbaspirillum sp. Root189]